MTRDAPGEFASSLQDVISHIATRHEALDELPTLPEPAAVQSTTAALPASLPDTGLGTTGSVNYILNSILPGCLQAQNGANYFGFVIGGVTPAAHLADILGGSYDENVQVTLPGQTASTAVEARVLELVLDLMSVPREKFQGRTITTGATASNVLGLGESFAGFKRTMLICSVRPGTPVRQLVTPACRLLFRSLRTSVIPYPPQSTHHHPRHPSSFLHPQSCCSRRYRFWTECSPLDAMSGGR